MKKILVPCDFSEPALSAYRQALDVAAQSKGAIHLLHVIEPPILNDTMFMPTLNLEEEIMKELREKANGQFKEIIGRDEFKKVKTTFDIQYGPVTTCILDCIKKNAIDFVIMGSTGVSGIKEYTIGSNSERIVRRSPVPVLVVKRYYERPVRNIVFPNDLDMEQPDYLIQKVKALQNFFKAKLHVVRINTPLNFIDDNVSRVWLENLAKEHRLSNYTLNIFNFVSIEAGIHEFAETINADMITLGTHSRRGLSHFMSGSIAEDVVNHSNGLVWTCTLKTEAVVVR